MRFLILLPIFLAGCGTRGAVTGNMVDNPVQEVPTRTVTKTELDIDRLRRMSPTARTSLASQERMLLEDLIELRALRNEFREAGFSIDPATIDSLNLGDAAKVGLGALIGHLTP